MEVIPAIDLRGGRCVRLYQGDFDRETVFSDDPQAVALQWQEQGARRLHVVDLDGARTGVPANHEVIGAIARALRIPIQVGGGIRSVEVAQQILGLGAQRIVPGTAAVENPALVQELLQRFGPQAVIVGVDARDGLVAVRGWAERSDVPALELIEEMAALGIVRLLYTDISRDGTLAGPNFDGVAQVVERSGMAVLAAGGIASLEHLKRLAELGVEGAIVGQALYTGDIDLRDALDALG